MSEYTYINQAALNVIALSQALPANGVFDGVITLDGTTLTVDTQTGLQASIDLAVSESQDGTLMANKTVRILEAQDASGELVGEGFNFTRPSDSEVIYGMGLDSDTENSLSRIEKAVGAGLASYPQIISTPSGRGAALNSSSDLSACQSAMYIRGVYILGDQVNNDASQGQDSLIVSIIAAANQSELDAITDTRK